MLVDEVVVLVEVNFGIDSLMKVLVGCFKV